MSTTSERKAKANENFAGIAQQELRRLGFYSGAMDEWAGPATTKGFRDLIKRYEEMTSGRTVKPLGNSERLMAHARKDTGLRELPGSASNARITKAIKEAASWLDGDDSKTAWCGCIMGLWCKEIGLPVPSEYYRAINWLNIGMPIDIKDAIPGDVVVISRSGGNHVALFVDSALTLFGGNQSNAVNSSKYDRSSLRGIRRL